MIPCVWCYICWSLRGDTWNDPLRRYYGDLCVLFLVLECGGHAKDSPCRVHCFWECVLFMLIVYYINLCDLPGMTPCVDIKVTSVYCSLFWNALDMPMILCVSFIAFAYCSCKWCSAWDMRNPASGSMRFVYFSIAVASGLSVCMYLVNAYDLIGIGIALRWHYTFALHLQLGEWPAWSLECLWHLSFPFMPCTCTMTLHFWILWTLCVDMLGMSFSLACCVYN